MPGTKTLYDIVKQGDIDSMNKLVNDPLEFLAQHISDYKMNLTNRGAFARLQATRQLQNMKFKDSHGSEIPPGQYQELYHECLRHLKNNFFYLTAEEAAQTSGCVIHIKACIIQCERLDTGTRQLRLAAERNQQKTHEWDQQMRQYEASSNETEEQREQRKEKNTQVEALLQLPIEQLKTLAMLHGCNAGGSEEEIKESLRAVLIQSEPFRPPPPEPPALEDVPRSNIIDDDGIYVYNLVSMLANNIKPILSILLQTSPMGRQMYENLKQWKYISSIHMQDSAKPEAWAPRDTYSGIVHMLRVNYTARSVADTWTGNESLVPLTDVEIYGVIVNKWPTSLSRFLPALQNSYTQEQALEHIQQLQETALAYSQGPQEDVIDAKIRGIKSKTPHVDTGTHGRDKPTRDKKRKSQRDHTKQTDTPRGKKSRNMICYICHRIDGRKVICCEHFCNCSDCPTKHKNFCAGRETTCHHRRRHSQQQKPKGQTPTAPNKQRGPSNTRRSVSSRISFPAQEATIVNAEQTNGDDESDDSQEDFR